MLGEQWHGGGGGDLFAACLPPADLALVGVGRLDFAADENFISDELHRVLAALGTAFAPISGGQFNPVVTVALWLVGKVRTIEGIRYIVAQLVGAVAAGFALKLAFGGFEVGDSAWSIAGGGSPAVAAGLTQVTAIAVEAVLTAVLVYAVLLTAVDKRAPQLGALLIGGVIIADIMVGGPLTGAAMNPARWFGPAIAFGDLSGAVVYIVGPLIGAVAAALSVRYLFAER